MDKEKSTDEINKQLWKEKMQALKESKGDLGELIRRTPGASAKYFNKKTGEEGETISRGPAVDKNGLRLNRGYSGRG